jgi:hypothetical protein
MALDQSRHAQNQLRAIFPGVGRERTGCSGGEYERMQRAHGEKKMETLFSEAIFRSERDIF